MEEGFEQLPDGAPWLPVDPAPLTAVPARQVSDLHGRRVIIGEPNQGWRYDLRADDPVHNKGQTFVPVLTEADYYRAELDQVEVFAPLVPIDRVWVERLRHGTDRPRPERDRLIEDELFQQAAQPPPDDLLSRLVSLDAPPDRRPTPARNAPGLTGRRVVLAAPSGEQRDLRAATEPYQNAEGDICVRICAETDWYRWGFTGQPPKCAEVPVYLIWVE